MFATLPSGDFVISAQEGNERCLWVDFFQIFQLCTHIRHEEVNDRQGCHCFHDDDGAGYDDGIMASFDGDIDLYPDHNNLLMWHEVLILVW